MATGLNLPLYKKTIKDDAGYIVGHAVCDSAGDYLTMTMQEKACDQMIEICNKHMLLRNVEQAYGQILFTLSVPIVPVEKPESQIITKLFNGELAVAESPAYIAYKKEFHSQCKAAGIYYPPDALPIRDKCQVVGLFYCNNKESKSISSYMEALLDCLVYAGIIINKGHRVVNNIDGSRMYYDAKNPRITIFIRSWGAKNGDSKQGRT